MPRAEDDRLGRRQPPVDLDAEVDVVADGLAVARAPSSMASRILSAWVLK